jgi:hypothetical protein
MACFNTDNVFTAIELEFASPAAVLRPPEEAITPGLDRGLTRQFTVSQARDIVLDRTLDDAERDVVLARIVTLAQNHVDPWELAAIWLMLPKLGIMAKRISRCGRMDIRDIRSELLLGFVEALRGADPAQPGLGRHLWSATYGRGWQAHRRFRHETPVVDLELIARLSAECRWWNSLTAPTVATGTERAPSAAEASTRVQGERLGSVAQRLGLRDRLNKQLTPDGTRRLIGFVMLHDGPPSGDMPEGGSASLTEAGREHSIHHIMRSLP